MIKTIYFLFIFIAISCQFKGYDQLFKKRIGYIYLASKDSTLHVKIFRKISSANVINKIAIYKELNYLDSNLIIEEKFAKPIQLNTFNYSLKEMYNLLVKNNNIRIRLTDTNYSCAYILDLDIKLLKYNTEFIFYYYDYSVQKK